MFLLKAIFTLISHIKFDTHMLACMLDSLVRVSRRVEESFLINTINKIKFYYI